jgi:RNA chaperone Hfq
MDGDQVKSNQMGHGNRVQDEFMKDCVIERTPVQVFLQSGVKLHGVIVDFDSLAFLFTFGVLPSANPTFQWVNSRKPQLIFKSSVASIVPDSKGSNNEQSTTKPISGKN